MTDKLTPERIDAAFSSFSNKVSFLYDENGFAYGPSIEQTILAALELAREMMHTVRRVCIEPPIKDVISVVPPTESEAK